MIDPEDMKKYFALEAESEALKVKMCLHATKIAEALHGKGAKVTSFGKKHDGEPYAFGSLSEDEVFSIPAEYLYAPDWEAKVAEYHRKQEIRHQKLMALWEKQKKEQAEDKELKELERLKKKYPDMV